VTKSQRSGNFSYAGSIWLTSEMLIVSYNLQRCSTAKYRGLFQAAQTVLKEEGVRAFWLVHCSIMFSSQIWSFSI